MISVETSKYDTYIGLHTFTCDSMIIFCYLSITYLLDRDAIICDYLSFYFVLCLQVVLGTMISYLVGLNKKFQVPILGNIPKGCVLSSLFVFTFLIYREKDC